MTYRFTFRLSYMNETSWHVFGNGEDCYLEQRHGVSEHERSISNGDDAYWQRNVVQAIGTIRRRNRCDAPLPADLVEAFNAYRHAEHESARRHFAKKYSGEEFDYIVGEPPVPVVGAYWKAETNEIVHGTA